MGASWMNTVLGALVILGDIGAFISKFFSENPTPISLSEWIVYGMGLATGIGLIVSKQFNVSNSPEPVAATAVSAKNEAKTNPSAPVA